LNVCRDRNKTSPLFLPSARLPWKQPAPVYIGPKSTGARDGRSASPGMLAPLSCRQRGCICGSWARCAWQQQWCGGTGAVPGHPACQPPAAPDTGSLLTLQSGTACQHQSLCAGRARKGKSGHLPAPHLIFLLRLQTLWGRVHHWNTTLVRLGLETTK